MAEDDNKPTADELASLAGFTVAFFKSDPELWGVFKEARKEDWDGQRLLARMRNTKWFKKHGEAARRATLLRTSDPAEYRNQLKAQQMSLRSMLVNSGIRMSNGLSDRIAKTAMHAGWNEEQIRAFVSRHDSVRRDVNQGRNLGGTLGQVQSRIDAAAAAYGVPVSRQWRANYLQSIAGGRSTEQDAIGKIQQMAANRFPALADQIKGGQTVMEIADPYRQSMGKLLEVSADDIGLDDRMIQRALTSKNKDGKFEMQSLWEFEDSVRNDSRWMQTNNARESMMNTGREILTQFGLKV